MIIKILIKFYSISNENDFEYNLNMINQYLLWTCRGGGGLLDNKENKFKKLFKILMKT